MSCLVAFSFDAARAGGGERNARPAILQGQAMNELNGSGWLPPEEHGPLEIAARQELQRAGIIVEADPEGQGVLIRGPGWQVRARTARQALVDMR